ncbi:MAG: DUF2341 domain-containing protein [Patescibacteria group bacterium]|nr:DUF2341 domain-containing protein [Patescibacteria group bacterium]MDD5164245.1 DUF2341 domain-containing protein [Patescibacteria group bacterium]MDD5534695.1 DUF2341 domain-containing protein [Patescibacteria group bacterium]
MMNLKKENLRQILIYLYKQGNILLSKFLKEFRFFCLIHIKRDKSCKKICSGWYIKSIAEPTLIKIKPRRQRVGAPTEASENLDWKEKYFDLQKQFRRSLMKLNINRTIAIIFCIALIVTNSVQYFPHFSKAATYDWTVTSQSDWNAGTKTDVDIATTPGDLKLADSAFSNAFSGDWSSLTGASGAINNGGAAVRVGNYIYALRGGTTTDFYRYDISGNSWSAMTDSPSISNWAPILGSWQYQWPLTINNTGGALSDYQFKIDDLDTQALVLAGKMEDDCADIRFIDSDGTTALNYWIESGTCNTATTDIWVKVPSISASSTKTIYLYYGNAEAENAASGDDTFVFFDDFEDGVLKSGWTFTNNGNGANTYSEITNSGKMTLTTASSDMYGGTYNFSQLRLTTIPDGDFEAILEINAAGVANYEIWGMGGSTDGNNFFRVGKGYHSGYGNKTIHFGKMLSGSPTEAGVSHSADFAYLKIRRVGTTYTSYWTDDLSSWTQIGSSQTFTPATFGLFGIKTTAGSMS